MHDDWLSSDEVSRIARVSARQLHHWDALGVVSPSLAPASGSGSRRGYLPDDLLCLLVARELRAASVGLQTIKAIVDAVRSAKIGVTCDSSTRLVWTAGRSAYLGPDADAAGRTSLREPAAISVHLGRLADEARARLPERRSPRVHAVTVEGRTYRVVVSFKDNKAIARCTAAPRCTARAASEQETLAAIREQLTVLRRPAVPTTTDAQPTPPARRTGGAAAWGESW